MKRASLILAGLSAGLTGCDNSSNGSANHQAEAKAQPKKATAFCFFKDAEMKDWATKRDPQGNIVLTGKAHVKDSRYKAVMGSPTVSGNTVEIAPTLVQNTGYEAPGDWWDVETIIPNSAAVAKVAVGCGANTVARLDVAPKS